MARVSNKSDVCFLPFVSWLVPEQPERHFTRTHTAAVYTYSNATVQKSKVVPYLLDSTATLESGNSKKTTEKCIHGLTYSSSHLDEKEFFSIHFFLLFYS